MQGEIFSTGVNWVTDPANPQEAAYANSPGQAMAGSPGKIARGGRLYITTQEVIFEANKMNLAFDGLRIPINMVSDVTTTRRKIQKLVVIHTVDGYAFEFVCWKRDKVKAAVQAAKSGQTSI